MDIEPNGYLPFKVRPEYDDRLIFIPVYIFPVESLERGIFSRPQYIFQTVFVNGANGDVTLADDRDIAIDYEFIPGSGQKEYVKLKISPQFAPEAAKFGAVPEDCRKWHSIVKHCYVFVRTDDMKLVWHVYIVREGEVIDTFTGHVSENSSMVGLLFK